MYKLIVTDMDGTLLNEDNKIEDRVKKSIEYAKEKGIKIILASGREYNSILPYAKELGATDMLITMNGAMVTDIQGNIIFEEVIDNDVCENIVQMAMENDIFPILFIDNNLYANREEDRLELFKHYTTSPIHIFKDLKKLSQEKPISKFILIDDIEKIKVFQQILKKKFGEKINIDRSKPEALEIYSKKTNKGLMVQKVADYYGIKKEEIIAIGDGENDISMISYAGMGVAMENALEELKKEAQFVTKDNSNNGVGYAIEKLI